MIDRDPQGKVVLVLLLHKVPEIGLRCLCNGNHDFILGWVMMAARRWRGDTSPDYASN
jgi:hypothetical protein